MFPRAPTRLCITEDEIKSIEQARQLYLQQQLQKHDKSQTSSPLSFSSHSPPLAERRQFQEVSITLSSSNRLTPP